MAIISELEPSDASISSSPATIKPPPNLRGVFVGTGVDGLSDPRIIETILSLTQRLARDVSVLYLGTATYDLDQFRVRQTQCFKERGCTVQSLNLALDEPHPSEIESSIGSADVIVVGGGNTLYAVDRWTKLGVVPHLQAAMERGAVLSGGSAGAICWFDGGHSDSMDPASYRDAMLEQYAVVSDEGSHIHECKAPEDSDSEETKDWPYIRVPGLGFLPGLLCPHHDLVQSNGILRANDFDEMLLRHNGERGICIDHFAVLVINGTRFWTQIFEEKAGSVVKKDDGTVTFCPERSGVPGVWIKEVRDGRVQESLCPNEGKVMDLLRVPSVIIKDDEAVESCRIANPS